MNIGITTVIILVIIGIAAFAGFLFLDFEDDSILIVEDVEMEEYDEIITVGTIHRDPSKMNKRYQPLAEYIAAKMSDNDTKFKGLAYTLPTEEDMINAINNKEMSIYFDSPLIGLKVKEQSTTEPLLLSWKEGYRDYYTVFFTRASSDISFEDLSNKTLVFEDSQSTTGYLLPMIHLQNAGYAVDEISGSLSAVFSLDDENTPIWILEGKGDVGVTSNLDFEDIPLNIKEKLKIIETTETIPRQLVFVSNHVENQDKLKELLLEMDSNSNTLEILEKISKTSKFSEIDPQKDLEPLYRSLEIIN